MMTMTISMIFMMEDDLVADQGQTGQGSNANNNREHVKIPVGYQN